VARNISTFESGNRVGSKLTPELSDLFINTVRQTGRISIASGRCAIGTQTARDWLRKGRREDAEPLYKEFADSVERARAEFLAVAARRLAQLAIGGTIDLPAYDKQNRIIRDANDEIIFEPRYFPPNPNALMHILDRIDPMPNLEPQPGVPEPPAQEVQMAEVLGRYSLTKEALQIMADLGVDVTTLPESALVAEFEAWMRQTAIETTASAEPAQSRDVCDKTPADVEANAASPSKELSPLEDNSSEPATPTEPPKPDPIESF
jgi:hypothetical protein